MINYFLNLNPVILALIATLITWLFTLLGASVVVFFKKVNKNVMDSCLAFSAGVMLAACFWSLLNPGIEMAFKQKQCVPLISSLGFLSGALILFLSDLFVKKVVNKNKKNSLKRSMLLITSITIHNIPEGLQLVSHLEVYRTI